MYNKCSSTSGINKGQVGRAIDIAVRAGYRSFDTAWIYQNEEEIGESLNNLFKDGVVKREDLFLMSKLWYNYTHYKVIITKSFSH